MKLGRCNVEMHHGTVWGTLWYLLVVYHLSGQNSRFAVLGNGNKSQDFW